MKFTKMHGLGNDFIVIDARTQENVPEQKIDKKIATFLCDRHFGVGADGLLLVCPSTKAHYRMQIMNADGSEPEMCGNGIRCFAKYVYEKDKLQEEVISVETLAGIKLPAVILDDKKQVVAVEVDMDMPKDLGEIDLAGYKFKKISMGNPHAVTFVEELSAVNLLEVGPKVENDAHFPNRTNVEFVKIIDNQTLEVLVWERGVGETLACGTGACACVVAAVLSGKLGRRAMVQLPGGKLEIEWSTDGHIFMRGPAKTVFEGEVFLPPAV